MKEYYIDINKLRNNRVTQAALARHIGVTRSYISALVTKKQYISEKSQYFEILAPFLTEKGKAPAKLEPFNIGGFKGDYNEKY